MTRLTQAAVRTELQSLGLVLTKVDGEYRVAYRIPSPLPGGHGRIAKLQAEQERSAYYTDDLADALDTGRAMHVRNPA